MKFKKRLIFSALVLLVLSLGNASAHQTCYDPRYGYYECNPRYSSYPDQGQAFVEGAILGIFLGGFLNSEVNQESGYWHRGHEHWGGYRGYHH